MPKPSNAQLEEIKERRAKASQAILASGAAKKLIVAGPGTGKSFTFRGALKQATQAAGANVRGLALTFIRNLVAGLAKDLGDVAEVYTFHGFCKRQMHSHAMDGLNAQWVYYPPLFMLLEQDFLSLGIEVEKGAVEHLLHDLAEEDWLVEVAIGIGDYYNAVTHTDLVYRVLRHFRNDPNQIPTYSLVVVDEYQDFSLLETSFIALLAEKNPVLIAGDDDQALYNFKGADARYIRELAANDAYEKHELPFCSRCTHVIVAAVNDAIAAALENGNLENRLKKAFDCYLPDKLADSESYPNIIHAQCSVERANAPYAGRYVSEQIARISQEEIKESRAGGYPTVLIIGPNPFLTSVYDEVREGYPRTVLKVSDQLEVGALDGYRLLAKDEASRLGWRIILYCHPFDGASQIIATALAEERELVELLPKKYRNAHIQIAKLVQQLLEGEISDDAMQTLCARLGRSADDVRAFFDVDDEQDDDEAEEEEIPEDQPTILCTSLLGAKGLSASHVFVVGFNDGHFPRNPKAITDAEACTFLVALSRTRKQCHLVSCKFLGRERRAPSQFLSWIAEHVETRKITSDYFKNLK